MKYVYLLQSISVPNQRYIGITADLDERIRTHNAGGSPHTSKYRPWKLALHLCFQDEQRIISPKAVVCWSRGQEFAVENVLIEQHNAEMA